MPQNTTEMFSKSCEYAIKAMVFIQYKTLQNEIANLNEIAEAIGSPVAFTAKILQQLRKGSLLASTMGIKGGFRIFENKHINLKDIIIAIDSDSMFTACVLGLSSCSSANPCPMHEKYTEIRRETERVTEETYLIELADKLHSRKISLK